MAAGMTRFSNSHLSNNSSDPNKKSAAQTVSKKIYYTRNLLPENSKRNFRYRCLEVRNIFCHSRKKLRFVPFSSFDDNIIVNGTTQESKNKDTEEMRIKLTKSIQGENLSSGLVQSIHDAARAIELGLLEHSSSNKGPWLFKAWLGVDKNEWVKIPSYQAAVHALLQAAIEISSRGDRSDGDTNIFVQRCLSRQCAPLENLIRQELSVKQPAAYEWFWSYQHTVVVTTFVNLFEKDPRFSAATSLYWKGDSSSLETTADISLLMLALSCLASIKMLGSAKLSCPQFFSSIPDAIGRSMDKLLDFVPLQTAYYSMKDIGLQIEFIRHFGPRAATVDNNNDQGTEEIKFWIDLVQNQLQRAIDREKIWSRLTTCESIEILEKDLAIFGFFIALGRSTQKFLAANNVSALDDQIEGIIRYLISGSVLYYPQLSSISSYQLFVEVVCEELEWLPFYKNNSNDGKPIGENKGEVKGIPQAEAISLVLKVCSYWMTSFIKYSAWLENPSHIKAARYLSRGHIKLTECMKESGMIKNGGNTGVVEDVGDQGSVDQTSIDLELDSFDKALESVEEALVRLEDLLQELHLSNPNPEHLKAACSDLERIRKLKKEAEFLEASFRAKAASLNQEDVEGLSISSSSESEFRQKNEASKSRGFWSFLVQNSTKKTEPVKSAMDQNIKSVGSNNKDSKSNEIRRFEILKRELIELEKRVQKTSDENRKEDLKSDSGRRNSTTGNHIILHREAKNDFISKSIEKLKKTSTDVWQGTQLLAIDAAAATVLLRRTLTGDKLTQKENQALKRTLTDLASVIPIGILMLLPVTAVGHAAMLAAIQRYVPALIPSTYGPDRLDLLRQINKVKETETVDSSSDEIIEAINSQ